jgi:stearoyl-CoA desaturase (delta-9 desaturase)
VAVAEAASPTVAAGLKAVVVGEGGLGAEGTRAPVSMGLRAANLIGVVLPLAGLVAAIVLLWPFGVGWPALAALVVMYLISGFGITVGYHRLFTHKAFETGPVMRAIIGVCGSMAMQGPILVWAANHRQHHQHSDGEEDPHSPHSHGSTVWGMVRGAWHAHVGWFLDATRPDFKRYVPDLAKDRVTSWVSKTFPVWVGLGMVIPAVVCGVWTMSWVGALLGFIWGGLVRVFLVHHVTWSINSVCHIWGSRPYDSHDESRNNPVFGILGLGEGWHNNHHAFPRSARHGLEWWQVDASYLVIRGLMLVGLAWDPVIPTRERLESKRKR